MIRYLYFLICLFFINIANADELHIAVASNFTNTLTDLVKDFSKNNNHKIIITQGATGILYAQIMQGAPYDIFLAADQVRPKLLEQNGKGVAGTRITYAQGVLAYWAPSTQTIINEYNFNINSLKYIAIANPNTSPYGTAAIEFLSNIYPMQNYQDKLVQGENISQAFHFTNSKNADAGLIAYSHLIQNKIPKNQYWIVPSSYYNPIEQQAIIINDKPIIRKFLAYLQTNNAKQLIGQAGYRFEEIK